MTENRGIERKTIIQIFPDWYLGNGIFSYLANNAVPWQAEDFTAELDNLYIGRSGYKYISTLLEKILGDKETFTVAQLQQIADNIYCKFNKSWNKLYNTLSLEYNPISNYDMTETSEDNGTGSKTIDRTGTLSRNGTRTAQGNTEQSADTSQNNDIYGFNSNSPVGDTTVSESKVKRKRDKHTNRYEYKQGHRKCHRHKNTHSDALRKYRCHNLTTND